MLSAWVAYGSNLKAIAGRLLLRLLAHAVPNMKNAKPINVFDLVVRDWINKRPSGKPFYFVQIGAHDGKHLDPIYRHASTRGWTGLLIEPQPDIFERLKANYQAAADRFGDGHAITPAPFWFLNAAIGSEDGEAILYRFKPGQNLPDHSTMLASFCRESLERNGHGYVGEIEALKVPMLSVKTLCSKYPMEKLDLLQLDTEGLDCWIVSRILAEGVKPQIIHFESWKNEAYFRLLPILESLGYSTCEVGENTVCYKAPLDSDFDLEVKNEGY